MTAVDGCKLVARTERARESRARENREYVRRMLARKQPEFAALLESIETELACPTTAQPANSVWNCHANACWKSRSG
jgi:hypothetical protein